MKRALLLILLALLLLPVGDAGSGDNTLDIQAELSRPGVKLVVVEFYATWCKPCMEAAPQWKKLHDKYRRAGLRFVVVSADEGVCSKPPEWSPDETLCDADGVLQRKFEVADLPTSLLFSWEGNVSMRSHHVKPVEDAIVGYFTDTTYKIEVDTPEVNGDKYAIGSNPGWVRDAVVSRVKKNSKFDVVNASAGALPRTTAETCSATFPANSVLRIGLTGDETGERFVSLKLEKDDCVKASAQEPYTGRGIQEDKASLARAVDKAVDAVLTQIFTYRTPGEADDGIAVKTYRNKFDDDGSSISNPVVDQQGYLAVESVPDGATVYVNGEEMGTTPFVKELMVGEYVVLVKSGALWIPAKKRVKLTQDGAQLQMKLGPNFGVLEVESTPAGADIWLDGEPTGQTTPYTFPTKKSGDYQVELKKEMYLSAAATVHLGEGKTSRVSPRLEENFGSIRVESTPAGASVYIDGRDSGKATPATVSPVRVGGREVVVRLASHNDYKKLVNVERGRTASVEAALTGKMGLLKVEAFVEKDGRQQPVLGAKVFIDGEEVGQTPFKKQVLVGTYKVAVRSDDGVFEGEVGVEEGKEKKVEVDLKKGGGVDVQWVYSNPAKISFTRSEVTLGQYKKCVEAGKCEAKHHKTSSDYGYCNWGHSDRDDHPMNCVDWYGATQYCEWAGSRLPTEEEWYAEASDNKRREYPWGKQEVTCDYAVWGDGARTDGCGKGSTWPVCSKPKGNSVSGLCDMSGNVWEWTSTSEGSARVLRGGSWFNVDTDTLRASGRYGDDPASGHTSFGFRCVRLPP